jgi:hypothetical protein
VPETRHVTEDASTIIILVTRPAPFWLPSKAERDPVTKKKIRSICGKLLLRPGANRIKRSRWEMTADHPTIQAHLAPEVGTLKLGADAAAVAKHTHAPDSQRGLEDLTIDKAKPWIAACTDQGTLSKWRNIESGGKNRGGILDLIDDRAEELDAEEAES